MQDVTELVTRFREAARHLWNTAFGSSVDWDDRDGFSRVCTALFDALVLSPARISDTKLPEMWESDPEPHPALQVVPRAESGVPIMINRSTPRCGYWDDPVDRVRPSDVRLEFIRFFDFDELGPRDFKYLEVHVADFTGQPHLVGRRALLEYENVKIIAVRVAAV